MQLSVWIVYFSLIISLIGFMWIIYRYKYLFLKKIITRKMVDKPLFSSLVIDELIKYFFKQRSVKRKFFLKNIEQNNYNDIFKEIKNPLLKAKIDLIQREKISPVKQSDFLYEMLKAFYWIYKNKTDKALNIIENLKKYASTKKTRALKRLLLAQIALTEGDLQVVSEEITIALKEFKKNNMLAEEAFSYYILGTAYRITGVYDSADFILRSSADIYKHLASHAKRSEVLGNLGLLMVAQNRFEEAEDFYLKAQSCISASTNHELYFFIVSQQAMSSLLQKNYKKAIILAQKALKSHRSNAGKSFATDVLARIYFEKKQWKEAYKWATFSTKTYLKEKNYAAAFECMYLEAEILVGNDDLERAEKTLRNLITQEKYHKSCFHIANAYTLLGLILLKKNKIKSAKTIFNQALKQELHNERNVGIAIDYANLAVVEKKCGNPKEMKKNLETALSYASTVDEELAEKIKAALN